MKKCPVCNKTEWDYDIVVNMDGLTFCGDCWHKVKSQARKMGFWRLPLTSGQYHKALKQVVTT